MDMAAVHSSCRLCIHLATMVREEEEAGPHFKKRPCKCTRGSKTVYHLYVRERGRFKMESIFLRYISSPLSIYLLFQINLYYGMLNFLVNWCLLPKINRQ